MLLDELFNLNDIECPNWLKGKFLEDDWKDSEYSLEENIHKWVLKTPMKHLQLTFTGEEYILTAFNEGMEFLVEWINEGTVTSY